MSDSTEQRRAILGEGDRRGDVWYARPGQQRRIRVRRGPFGVTASDKWTREREKLFGKFGGKYANAVLTTKGGVVALSDILYGRQMWDITPVDGSNDVYTISPTTELNPTTRDFLSATQDGQKVELSNSDDGSGRQRWQIVQVDMPFLNPNRPSTRVFHIGVSGGISTGRVFLSSWNDNLLVNLQNSDDGSGLQQWEIEAW